MIIPGIPDSPQECYAINTTDRIAILECIKGYDGGERGTFTFTVLKSQPWQSPTEVETDFEWSVVNEVAFVRAHDLEPNNNYTLLVYQENKFGRSESSFGVLIRTEGKSFYAATVFLLSHLFSVQYIL